MERIEASGSTRDLTEMTVEIDQSSPVCSIVIPTYNGRELLGRCLASIVAHKPPSRICPIEVLVADDCSTDGTAEWLSNLHPNFRLVSLERNGGFCAAANAGIAAARGQFVQLLNNDTEVTAGWLEAGLAPFSDPTVGSVAPLVLVRSDLKRVDSAGDTYSLIGWPAKRGHGQAADVWSARVQDEVFGASGSSAFYRSEALRKVGGFDPLFGSYYEDIDIAFRLRWAGYRCLFTPACRIHHDVSATYDHRSSKLQRRMSRNAELVFWSNLPSRTLALALVPHLAFVFAQAAWRLVRWRLSPFLLGKLDAVRVWGQIRDRRRTRMAIARSAIRPPHFSLTTGSIKDVRDHLKRPLEHSRIRSKTLVD